MRLEIKGQPRPIEDYLTLEPTIDPTGGFELIAERNGVRNVLFRLYPNGYSEIMPLSFQAVGLVPETQIRK